jgi:hypothetical protein
MSKNLHNEGQSLPSCQVTGIGFDLLPDATGTDRLFLTFNATVTLSVSCSGFGIRESVLAFLRHHFDQLEHKSSVDPRPRPEQALTVLGGSYKDFITSFSVGKIGLQDLFVTGIVRARNFDIGKVQDDKSEMLAEYRFVRRYGQLVAASASQEVGEGEYESTWEFRSPTNDFDGFVELVFNHHTSAFCTKGAEVGSMTGSIGLWGRMQISRDEGQRAAMAASVPGTPYAPQEG